MKKLPLKEIFPGAVLDSGALSVAAETIRETTSKMSMLSEFSEKQLAGCPVATTSIRTQLATDQADAVATLIVAKSVTMHDCLKKGRALEQIITTGPARLKNRRLVEVLHSLTDDMAELVYSSGQN